MTHPILIGQPPEGFVYASATVDPLAGRPGEYTVHVKGGRTPLDTGMVYTISAESETEAAHAGMDAFVKMVRGLNAFDTNSRAND